MRAGGHHHHRRWGGSACRVPTTRRRFHSTDTSVTPPPRLGFASSFLHGTLRNILHDDPSWVATQTASANSVFLPFHRLRPLVKKEDSSLGWVSRESVALLLPSALTIVLGISKVLKSQK